MAHGTLLIPFKPLLILLVIIQQENGVVQRYPKLQYCRQCLGQIRNIPQKAVRSHIVNNGNPNTQKKNQRNKKRLHRQPQDNQTQDNCNHHINRHFSHCQILNIRNHAGHSANVTLFLTQSPHIADSLHRIVRRSRFIKQGNHHRCVSLVKRLPDFIRQHFNRHADIHYAVIPEDVLNMLHTLNLFL